MKVGELLARLAPLDPKSDVLCCTEDSELVPVGHTFLLLDIEAVDTADAEKHKGGDNIPSLRFGRSESSCKHVLMHVTSEF
jgi:hypothetical protein